MYFLFFMLLFFILLPLQGARWKAILWSSTLNHCKLNWMSRKYRSAKERQYPAVITLLCLLFVP